ncbi:error-prone DNA polymerase [Thalassospira lucentensis]|uniref:Error-prone DNA polymerase n=1 Tax=Thalassospira lucentensis TaxID=168935 RepID=A0A358HWU4_9PROT|nr:error-prone DNA polymerase [Thalassospira lucentensis]HBU99656.1 error-prone DNA polymerase [Thalassospira lucentensis]HCW67287.1 error-prone DNA polymerase [Thalassospira lucentensis]|tara:strand:- start:1175 stop:4483 length:3309 start_codon:yes stop_codon:yes gene_type:complete
MTQDIAPTFPDKTGYAELQVSSNFSFLRGASHAEELVLSAATKGLHAIAITDRNSLAGIVRGHSAHAHYKDRLNYVVGCRIDPVDAPSLLCYPTDRAAYARLCRLLTVGKRRAPKGSCEIYLSDILDHAEGQLLIVVPPQVPDDAFRLELEQLQSHFAGKIWLAVGRFMDGFDSERLAFTEAVETDLGIPAVVTNDVHMHLRSRKPLQDVLTCIRHHCTIEDAGYRLFPNGERHIKSPYEMTRLFPDHPQWLARTVEIADQCRFSLTELTYEYPDENDGSGEGTQERLVRLTWEGAQKRYPDGIPDKVRVLIETELKLIDELGFSPYFLTVHDIVAFARSRNILCQGRGSAANSSVCFCLHVTSVDPAKVELLFSRFISNARNEPPDIDVDFEHERREEVIQHIYERYGRDRAGLTATVISYRSRSAIRDVGKVFGLSEDTIVKLTKTIWGSGSKGAHDDMMRQSGIHSDEPRLKAVLGLAGELTGFPRHLSQHVGGFVITRGPLCELSPIANAAMADRTTIEWDKDDIDALGILKVDVLALGMLTCIRKAFDALRDHKNIDYTLATLPKEDGKVYDMLAKADSIGTFQVESRAQMSMLPRLRPRSLYDLTIQVAIVRPGPIQGGMVHPFLQRRMRREKVDYPSRELEAVLKRTCGVPLFQEQAMQIAIVAAGYSGGEADNLRRAMATFKRTGTIGEHRDKFINGMLRNGYDQEFAERCFKQIEGFADYGFPESHAASFAILAYASSWLKCHHPDVFLCALLNAQPMGFYAPAQLIADAKSHGVRVLEIDINHSFWDNRLERELGRHGGYHSVRLGFRQIRGFGALDALAVMGNRPLGGYQDLYLMARQTGLSPAALEKLAEADAFGSLGLSRREALWAVRRFGKGRKAPPVLPLFEAAQNFNHNMGVSAEFGAEAPVDLPVMGPGEEIVEDYASLRLSLKGHPMTMLRDALAASGICKASDLPNLKDGDRVTHAGLAIVRQRPGTASGVVFITLEDEAGIVNLVVWSKVMEKFRREIMTATVLGVTGKLQREDGVTHIIADKLVDLTGMLQNMNENTKIARSNNTHPRNLRWATGLDNLGSSGVSKPQKAPSLKVDSHDFH